MAINRTAAALGRDLKRISEKFEIGFNKVIRKTAFDLQAKIIKRTPRDTGRAAGSWGISEDVPSNAVLPEGTYRSPETASNQLTVVSTTDKWQTLWIFNNLPYIQTLEFGLYPGIGPKTIAGFSTQAPSGMVRVSITEQRAQIEKDLRNVLR